MTIRVFLVDDHALVRTGLRMILSAEALLRRNPTPTEADIRAALSGNLCRCTGYVKIVESVRAAAAQEPA